MNKIIKYSKKEKKNLINFSAGSPKENDNIDEDNNNGMGFIN